MRSISIVLLLFVLSAAMVLLSACQGTPQVASDPSAAAVAGESVATGALDDRPVATMWVHGMGCPQCSYNVDLQLKKVPGVEAVKVDMSTGRVTATLSPTNPPTREQLTRAIQQTTFTLVRIDMSGDNDR